MTEVRKTGQLDIFSGVLSELLYLGFSEGRKGQMQKTITDIVDRCLLDFVDDTLKNCESKVEVISLASVLLDVDALRKAYTHLLTVIFSHKPEMKVSQAIREQYRWSYGKVSPSLTELFKQFLLPFEVDEILTLLRQILEQQEVNWQLLLSFVSVITVCMPDAAKLLLEFIDRLLQEGLDGCEIENTIMGMLLARQACFQGPHVFVSYSDWFQRTFSEGSRSLAGNRKSFTFFMKFLTDLVPYETAQHIKVHILHPPFVPPKCRQILTDYIFLAKTRLEDLQESLDLPDVESSTSSTREKVRAQVVSEVESTVKMFESTGKVPTSILEASIFRKPYYIGQFLPVLLQPRPLPDVPDSKMKLIAALKRSDKVPQSLYANYEKGCKKEASQLLEGVFIDSDSDDDMELSPFEQFENIIQQLKNTVKNTEGKTASKYTLSEVLSLLCEKIENVLSVSPQGHMHSPEYITIETESIYIDPLQLKVVDVVLNVVNQMLHSSYMESSPSFTWLSKLVLSLSQYRPVLETLFKRIFTLIIKQGISLENHQIDCLGAVLVEIQFLGEQLPWLQVIHKGQGHTKDTEKNTLPERIFDMLPVTTGDWMRVALGLSASYLKYMYCAHEDTDQSLVIFTLVKKFFYLSTRQIPHLRMFYNDGHISTGNQDLVSAVFTSEIFQNLVDVSPMSVSDWVDFEISVWPTHDILTDFQRYEYFTWIVYNYFVSKGQGDCYSIASAVLSGILKNDLRCQDGNVAPGPNSRSYLVGLLQELTRMFPQCVKERNDELPWLPQQLMNSISMETSEIMKHSIILQFFRLCLSLPAYLMYSDTPFLHQVPTTLTPIVTFINVLVQQITDGLFLPASISVFLCQGLTQVFGNLTSIEVLNELIKRCPVFMVSVLVNYQLSEPFLMPALNHSDSLLKVALYSVRVGEYSSLLDPWQQAAILFSQTVDPANRVKDSIWQKFMQSRHDVSYQCKVCCSLVQMSLLQLTDLKNFQQTEDQVQTAKLESVLTDILKWAEKKHIGQIFFPAEIEEKTQLCVSERLIKLKNLSFIRFFMRHHGETSGEKYHSSEFLTGVLGGYSDVVTMFDQQEEPKLMKVEEIQMIDKFLVKLIRSTSPDILLQMDQDVFLRCGPAVADCVIRMCSN